jgi:membrane dipeptidase
MARSAGVPVVASHSNARALAEHPRNLHDSEIRAVASTGGLVAVNFHSAYLARGRAGTLDDVVRHVVHVVRVAGVAHVGVGSDFEGGIRPPSELTSVADVQKLPPALRAAGLSDSDVRRIMGSNALSILEDKRNFQVSPAVQR